LSTPLSFAIMRNAYNAVTFLLDAGADIDNTLGGRASTPLIDATSKGNLKMVKMLLERGADIHATYWRDGKEQFNALKWAVIEGHDEIADYLRSKGAVMLEDEAQVALDPTDEVIEFLSDYFKGKPLPLGIMEIVPASVPLSVRIFPPVKRKRKNTFFVTSGLMEYALNVPKGKECYCFAEYFIEMPGDWPTTDEALSQEKYFWPISWLKAIGRYPHEKETFYGEKKTVKSSQIPALVTPDGEYDSALVERVSDLSIQTSDGRNVLVYRVTPF